MATQKSIFDDLHLDSPPAPGLLETSQLYEDADNPRTYVPEVELAALADDIRQNGILQPSVVHPADANNRYRIVFGAKRWRAAQRIGLSAVPAVIRCEPINPYMQVSENQKRHGLAPLDLARFIHRRIDAGETNTAVARQLGMDLTTVAHHLALLDLPPALEEAMQSGRCSSPRTLYELSKVHEDLPERVAELVAGTELITLDAVAAIRHDVSASSAPARTRRAVAARIVHVMTQSTARCDSLDATLVRLSTTDRTGLPAEELAALRQRVEQLVLRIDA